ncbi:repressor [Phaeobacter inhibens]|uniref:XRE family transcriptional regulator n=1 Tax=Phaeobacter inhibens TaxID=221822 RepID=UPI0027467917|nr:S24 family peptidase [Phaeobacter inhibens]GLO70085.1 repressor [Phaeobacter inhibens]GLO70612.1 repressor [Phaeobacter inhibens]
MADFSSKMKAIREQMALSRRAFGELLGAPEAKIQKIEIGAQRADHEFLAAISRNTDFDLNWLLGGDGGTEQPPCRKAARPSESVPPEAFEDFVAVPGYDVSVSAGNGVHATDENVVGHYAFSRRWLTRRNLTPANLAVVRVAGDSMQPKLYNGDLAVIDTTSTDLKDGVTYVFRLGEDLLIKRLQILPQRNVNLCSDNPQYSPIQIDLSNGELTSIGRVVASMHEW